MDSSAGNFGSEIEAIKAVYSEEVLVSQDQDAPFKAVINFRIHQNFEDAVLQIFVAGEYPRQTPEMSVSGLLDDQASKLLKHLKAVASDIVGEPMLVSLTSSAREWLEKTSVTVTDQAGTVEDSTADSFSSVRNSSRIADEKGTSRYPSPSRPKQPMRTALDVINRIRWDSSLDPREFRVGVLDRFDGVLEDDFTSYDWDDLLFPQHRVQYFKYKNETVWDKRALAFDNVFGSRGAGFKILDIVERYTDNGSDMKSPEELSGGCGRDESGQSATHSGEKQYRNFNRPNHFVCIRIDEPETVANLNSLQENLVAGNQRLSQGLQPISMMHVTLCMLRISMEELTKAEAVLRQSVPALIKAFSACGFLTLQGLSMFGDRLIYAAVGEHPGLCWYAKYLQEKFQECGIKTPGNHPNFMPHVSILRLSRPMENELNINFLDRGIILPYQHSAFGSQMVDSVFLCPTGREHLDADGFYHRIYEVRNNLLDVHKSLSDLMVDRVCELKTQGLLCEETSIEVCKRIEEKSGKLEDFLRYLDPCTTVGFQNHHSANTLVLVLRGLPGSGKSHLLRNLGLHFDVTVCSADSYFEDTGHKYNVEELSSAHQHCLDNFFEALDSQPQIIAVDNTHSRLWEYHLYVALARMLGFEVSVIEMACTGPISLKEFAVRNVHGVSLGYINNMFENWEVDTSSMTVQPSLDRSKGTTDPVAEAVDICKDVLKQKPKSYEVLYSALILTAKSRCDLLRHLKPTQEHVAADQLVMCSHPGEKHTRSLPLGQLVRLQGIGSIDDGSIQGLAVEVQAKPPLKLEQNPYIIISVANDIALTSARSLLSQRKTSVLTAIDRIELEGIVACVVGSNTDSSAPLERIVDKSHLSRLLEGPLDYQQPDFSLVTSDLTTVELNIFDFDGTLFETPDFITGIRSYKKETGESWPYRGYYGRPESLLPPMRVYPGPALAEYHAHSKRSGVYTVVLTARMKQCFEGVQHVLNSHQLVPDQLILKEVRGSSTSFKVKTIKHLLLDFPNVQKVKVWDDLSENLSGFHQLKKERHDLEWEIVDALSINQDQRKRERMGEGKLFERSPEIGLEAYSAAQGWFPDDDWRAAAQAGVSLIARVWKSAIGYGFSSNLAMVFGSYPLGRKSDVDICLLAPDTFTSQSCMMTLETALRGAGVRHIYCGHSTRCPRLKVKIDFQGHQPQEFDIVFCRTSQDLLSRGALNLQDLRENIPGTDAASRLALGGVEFLQSIETIAKTPKVKMLATVVEVLSRVLQSNCMKGNAFHCPRTFHLTRLVADCLRQNNGAIDSSEKLLESALRTGAEYTAAEWKKIVGQFVPDEYTCLLQSIFQHSLTLIRQPGFPSWESLPMLFSCYRDCCGTGMLRVRIDCKCGTSNEAWSLAQFLEAKAGNCIRSIISSGCLLQPGRCLTNEDGITVEFAVESGAKPHQTTVDFVTSLRTEVSSFNPNAKFSCAILDQRQDGDHG